MRPSKASELKKAAGELVTTLLTALKEVGVTLDLDQQLAVMQKLKSAIDGASNNGGADA